MYGFKSNSPFQGQTKAWSFGLGFFTWSMFVEFYHQTFHPLRDTLYCQLSAHFCTSNITICKGNSLSFTAFIVNRTGMRNAAPCMACNNSSLSNSISARIFNKNIAMRISHGFLIILFKIKMRNFVPYMRVRSLRKNYNCPS